MNSYYIRNDTTMSVNPTREQIVRNEPEYDNTRNPKFEMEDLFSAYLASKPAESKNRKTAELEVRFQGIGGQPLTKIDYDNIIQHLYAAGFTTPNPDGTNILRIQPEYVDARKGVTKLSNIRAEVVGVDLIEEYCATNSIQHLLHLPSTMSARSDKIQFTQKTPIKKRQEDPNSDVWRPVDFRDHNFRIGYQYEQTYGPNGELVRGMIEAKKWADSKKVFRHLNRVRFSHPTWPVHADITILRSSAKSGKVMIPHYTLQEANVFNEPESYEMELEIDNMAVGPGTKYDTLPKLLEAVRAVIRIVLSAIQGTNYPITNTEMRQVQHAYLRMVKGVEQGEYDMQSHRVTSSDFIGPSSKTLQIENIVTGGILLENYTVTDKADGERKMLYVADGGKLYWIDSTMRVQFTGAMTNEKKLYGSLFDGEHIKYDKKRAFINLYAVFDVYFIHRKSVREFPFVKTEEPGQEQQQEEPVAKKPTYRWTIMNTAVQLMKPVSSTTGKKSKDAESECPFRIQCKEFHVSDSARNIFQNCSAILSRIDDGLFEYETDGLIFTPAKYGVGGGPSTAVGPLRKFTWEESFKWKPAEFNTVDFLVRVQKDNTGKDKVFTHYKDGTQFAEDTNVLQYKQLILHCGFDEKKHGFLNPFQQLLDGDFKTRDNWDADETSNTYMAKPFIPSNPYDDKAFICNVELLHVGVEQWVMETEEHDLFDENMIVEFRYDLSKVGGWRWVPLRVRYDKTSQMRQKGARVFGNDYTTANSNWYSIHHPITKSMISTGQDIPEESSVGEDVYYNRKGSGKTTTRALRDFHNLYVKSKLIAGAANRKDSLIDFSVGKAGDLAKWRYANLGFVLGIDVSKDNIVNKVDGACARYLGEAAKHRGLFGALFLVGNSANNIRNGDAFASFKEKRTVQAIFGEGAKNQQELGAGVYKHYGVASDGFNIASCQFSLHYFFENAKTLHNFVRNVAECTKVGGTFIGTCWDGKTVFRLLKDKAEGEAYTIMREGRKMFQLTKMYDETGFPEDEMSLGYGVSVYQESIGQAIVEYLVNFDFLVRIMENYGFVLADKEDTAKMGLPGGTGMFETLYYEMEQEAKRSPNIKYGDALYMTEEEKTVSFLNRYFVFKKVRNVATERVTQLLETPAESEGEPEESVEKITKKLNKRQKLATKEPAVTKDVKAPKEKRGFIRPIKKAAQIVQMKISVYDPVEDTPIEMVKPREVEPELEPEEVAIEMPEEEGPAIVLAPPKAKRAVIRKPKLAKV